MSNLLQEVRAFWFNNVPGPFRLDDQEIPRAKIQLHGGPAYQLNSCPTCQRVEWLSRIRQQNLYTGCNCPVSGICKTRCERQGNDLWTNYHLDHWFAVGRDTKLNAPRGICLLLAEGVAHQWQRFWDFNCDTWDTNLKRQLAQACQYDVVKSAAGVDWSGYDFFFLFNSSENQGFQFPRPNIPIIMYGHDSVKFDYQTVIDRFEPDYFLTPYPTPWQDHFRFSARTKIRFYGQTSSMYFARPNLSRDKRWDLVMVGATGDPLYDLRVQLDRQVSQLRDRFRINTSHDVGFPRCDWPGPVKFMTPYDGWMCYMNAWSEFLGAGNYVIYGPHKPPANEYAIMKVYECLGCGAVPIIPEVKDFKYIGIQPMVHYIPLSRVWQNNEKLAHYLSNYDSYRYIAENAVGWYKENADSLLLNGFEDVIREATGHRYPRRLV